MVGKVLVRAATILKWGTPVNGAASAGPAQPLRRGETVKYGKVLKEADIKPG
jgi:hypothetical protein